MPAAPLASYAFSLEPSNSCSPSDDLKASRSVSSSRVLFTLARIAGVGIEVTHLLT